jgi:hypothetical protein
MAVRPKFSAPNIHPDSSGVPPTCVAVRPDFFVYVCIIAQGLCQGLGLGLAYQIGWVSNYQTALMRVSGCAVGAKQTAFDRAWF